MKRNFERPKLPESIAKDGAKISTLVSTLVTSGMPASIRRRDNPLDDTDDVRNYEVICLTPDGDNAEAIRLDFLLAFPGPLYASLGDETAHRVLMDLMNVIVPMLNDWFPDVNPTTLDPETIYRMARKQMTKNE
jgi:hypothetical protein